MESVVMAMTAGGAVGGIAGAITGRLMGTAKVEEIARRAAEQAAAMVAEARPAQEAPKPEAPLPYISGLSRDIKTLRELLTSVREFAELVWEYSPPGIDKYTMMYIRGRKGLAEVLEPIAEEIARIVAEKAARK